MAEFGTGQRLIQGAWGRLNVTQLPGRRVRIDQADLTVRIAPTVMQALMTTCPWARVDLIDRPPWLVLVVEGSNRTVAYEVRWMEAYGMWHGHQARLPHDD